MNGPGDTPQTLSATPDTRPCGLISIIPTLGMSSCRGRAEAFARRLSSKLKTLGSQTEDDPLSPEDEPIINGSSTNTWMSAHEADQTVTDLQPLRHESDSFFDFDLELESPGSPVDECEYLRLVETASNTPHNSATESGYVCASAASSQSSSDGPYYDVETLDNASAPAPNNSTLPTSDVPNYASSLKLNGIASVAERLTNGHHNEESHESNTHTSDTQTSEQVLELHPKNVPDVHTEVENGENSGEHLSTLEMVSVQDQIINELQKQSNQRSENNSTRHEESTECVANIAPVATLEYTENQSTESNSCSLHTITNGHFMNGEEFLNIEVTKVETQQDADCKESQEKEPTSQPLTEEISSESHATPEELQPKTEFTSDSTSESTLDSSTESTKESTPELTSESTAEPTKLEPSVELTIDVKLEPKAEPTRHSVLDTTDDEDDCRPQRVRRCSSLKTGKTPPGTPGRKKIVRFADVLGLDLADVKTFLDEVPTIPKSAFEDLEIMDSEPPMQLGPKSDKLLMPLFQQPGGMPTFLDVVREKQVSLENAAISDPINQTITGSVRVRNLDFHKSVHIRYTLDGWRSFADLQANYVNNSCDGFSDTYTFVLFGNSLNIGQRLEFAVRFQCKGQQFWDNNYGTNYCFQCLPSTTPAINTMPTIVPSHHQNNMLGMLSPGAGDTWCSSFY